jgi:fibronectin type 3 domain-containing protein
VTGAAGDVTKTTSFTLTVNSSTETAHLTLAWQDNSNNEDDFAIERKSGTNGAYSQIASVAANVTSYLDNSVTRGVTYCYRVQAISSAGASAYSNEACKAVP